MIKGQLRVDSKTLLSPYNESRYQVNPEKGVFFLNPKPKQVFIITSERLQTFAEVNYKKVFKVDEIPKDGILLVKKGIYLYSEHRHHHHSEKVCFKAPLDDIIATKKVERVYKKLQALSISDQVFLFADYDFEYSQHILWELHHEFKFSLRQMFYIRDFNSWSFLINSSPYYDLKKRLQISQFSNRVIRTMIALSMMKLSVYQYSLHHLYGPPLNLASLIMIKFNQESNQETDHNPIHPNTYIRQLDISLFNVKILPGVTKEKIAPRLYQQLAEDIKGFKEEGFLNHLIELRDLFAKRLISYLDYKEELKSIFNLQEGQI
jgi:hypothetical protein